LKYIVQLLEALQKAAYDAVSIEIAFVISSTANPTKFTIPTVTGTLGKFRDKPMMVWKAFCTGYNK